MRFAPHLALALTLAYSSSAAAASVTISGTGSMAYLTYDEAGVPWTPSGLSGANFVVYSTRTSHTVSIASAATLAGTVAYDPYFCAPSLGTLVCTVPATWLGLEYLGDDDPNDVTLDYSALSPGLGHFSAQTFAGNDTVEVWGSAHTVIDGGDDDDIIIGGEGFDRINGGQGEDRLYGMGGYDILDGGSEPDELYGGNGNDALNGDDGDDDLFGGEGDDTLEGGSGNDTLYGEAGDDSLTDVSGTDDFDAGPGEDWIDAADGSWDSVSCGADNDVDTWAVDTVDDVLACP